MYVAGATALAAAVMVACGSDEADLTMSAPSDDAGTTIKRDSAPVEPAESGAPVDAGLAPPPTCEKYCDLVTENCTGANAQYASRAECMKLCPHLALNAKTRTGSADERQAASVACRQYWADSPAKTDPAANCLAAGPFGGNACGDRCTAFCDVVLSACSGDAGTIAPYEDRGSCASACAGFTYRDAGTDGGGEGPDGPSSGDSLNCRLYQLRAAVSSPDKCGFLKSESSACKNN